LQPPTEGAAIMRLTAIAAAFVVLAGSAWAQAPLTGTTGPLGTPNATGTGSGTEQVAPPATSTTTPRRRGRSLQDRFDAANVTHDGHLTLEQARSKMPSVARDFAAIDTDNKGYVTIDQIRDHARTARAARRAAAHTAPAQ
jgi:hypothetical protein